MFTFILLCICNFIQSVGDFVYQNGKYIPLIEVQVVWPVSCFAFLPRMPVSYHCSELPPHCCSSDRFTIFLHNSVRKRTHFSSDAPSQASDRGRRLQAQGQNRCAFYFMHLPTIMSLCSLETGVRVETCERLSRYRTL